MNNHLSLIRRIQKKYPECVVCGSFGLFLHGIVLDRDWSKCDIDFVSKDWIDNSNSIHEEEGSNSDFEAVFEIDGIKVEIAYNPEVKYCEINGINVQNKEDILRIKKLYSTKGYPSCDKHRDDLIKINYNG